MFPLKERVLIRGAEGHLKAGLGVGADYRAKYQPFVIPFDGRVETYWGKQGGNWLRLIRPNGHRIELAHLQSYAVKSGVVEEGQPGGITGNTGEVTDFPHLHIQIFDKQGKRLDPEQYDWGSNQSNQKHMLNAIKRKGSAAVYALCGTTALPFASWESFLHAGGDPNKIIEMDDEQFFKYAVMDGSPIINK
jgi:hypothetical protein